MNKEEIASILLHYLYDGRVYDIGLVCDIFITCRNNVIRDRAENTVSGLYAPEEAEIVIGGGELAQEVYDLLQKEDLNGIETVLRRYKS